MEGLWVVVWDLYFIWFFDGVVGVLVEWFNDIVFLLRFENVGESGRIIYGVVELEGYDDDDKYVLIMSWDYEDFFRKIYFFE